MNDEADCDGVVANSALDVSAPRASSEGVAKLLLSALDHSSEGILVLDAEMRFIFGNARMRSLYPELCAALVARKPYRDIVLAAFEAGVLRTAGENPVECAGTWSDDLRHGRLDVSAEDRGGAQVRIRGERIFGNCYAVFHACEPEASNAALRCPDGSVPTYAEITELRRHAARAEKIRRDLEHREARLLQLAEELENANREKQALLSSFEAIIENIDYGVVFMDQDLRVGVVNRAWREMWGVDAELVTRGHTMRELMEFNRYNNIYDVGDDEWESYAQARVEAVRRGSVAPMEMHRKDGKILRYQCVALPDGRRMLTYFDITDIKRQEVLARENASALEVVLNNISHGLTWFDGELTLRAWNPKFFELLDFPEQSFRIGDPFEKFIRFNAERGEYGTGDVEKMVRERIEIAKRFEPHSFERARGDGTTLRIEGFPVAEGGFVTVYTDVTEQLKHRLALEEEKERAKAASRAKSQFLANMSHEIRTPLNAIVGMAELFQKTDLDIRQNRFADTILQSSNGLLAVINDVLDFSSIEAGKISLDPSPFNLREAVEDIATLISSQAADKDVEVMVRYQPGTPQEVCADAGRIRQVIINLLGNAVKFTEAGHVLVDVAGERRGDMADLTISVVDTGPGIPADRLESVFDAFQQVDSSSTRRHGGTGLGLAISKRIVDALGGRMGIQSDLGNGSTFWFKVRLPIAEGAEPGDPVAAQELAGLPILVVDDSDINRLILEEQLTGWGLAPTIAESGGLALAALGDADVRGTPYGMVILDHQMPDMDGIEFVQYVEASDRLGDIPIVVLTSMGLGDDWNRLRDLGVAGVLEKPVRSSLLLEAIRGAVVGPPVCESPPLARQDPEPEARARWTVLVAEDNRMNRTLIEHMLHGTDFRPVFAEDGEAAVKVYQEIQPDVVVMDVSMPKLDGYEATALIREQQERDGRRVPIIGATAHAFAEDRRRCLESGMDDHLAKPICMDALKGMLERWIGCGEPGAVDVA